MNQGRVGSKCHTSQHYNLAGQAYPDHWPVRVLFLGFWKPPPVNVPLSCAFSFRVAVMWCVVMSVVVAVSV